MGNKPNIRAYELVGPEFQGTAYYSGAIEDWGIIPKTGKEESGILSISSKNCKDCEAICESEAGIADLVFHAFKLNGTQVVLINEADGWQHYRAENILSKHHYGIREPIPRTVLEDLLQQIKEHRSQWQYISQGYRLVEKELAHAIN